MSKGATKDYDFAAKRHWRRWVWNRIAERTKNPRDALVLFLAGPEAPDIDVARAHGFRAQNMIAVERDPRVVSRLRGRKVLTIEGDLLQTLEAWPASRRVDVLLADLCSGLTQSTQEISRLLTLHGAFSDATIAVNLLRGREAAAGPLMTVARNFMLGNQKHRGEAFAVSYFSSPVADPHAGVTPLEGAEWMLRNFENLVSQSNVAFNSYASTSSSQYFDSAVLKSPWGTNRRSSGLPPSDFSPAAYQNTPQKGRVSAVLAHHTRGTYAP